MNLPSKDRDGNSYLSYSQIQTFKRSEEEYYNRYILKQPFEGNAYTDFGNKVGQAIEHNDFSGFSLKEQDVLKTVTRLDQFEKRVYLKYEGFYLIGFIDTCSDHYLSLIDYKTGGIGKHVGYASSEYSQLQIYTLALRQEFGVHVKSASVEFIGRKGNAFIGEELTVMDEPPIVIEQDISEGMLKHVYWDTLKTAKAIELFYNNNK